MAELARYQEAYAAYLKAMSIRTDLVAELKQLNQRIFATRDRHKETIVEQISVIQDPTFMIGLILNQGKDRNALIEYLSTSPHKPDYSGKQFKSQEWPAVIASKHDPFSLSEALLENISDALVADLEKESEDGTVRRRSIDAETSKLIMRQNNPLQKIEAPQVMKIDRVLLEKILRLQEVYYDDEFYITLNGKPIQHSSPGQRCSAMLPIVTLTSESPIVIDQPGF